MRSLKVKSIVIVIIAILTSTNIFSQDHSYTDKEEFFEGQNRRVLKANFIGNLIGTTKISYEQIHKAGRSFEIKATLIEMGEVGVFGSFGYKIYRKPAFVVPNMQRRNILEGAYLKPEIFVGIAKVEDITDYNHDAEPSLGLVLNLGNQWLIGDSFVIDTYIAVSYTHLTLPTTPYV